MYLTDYHTHTTLSPDAVTPISLLCRRAEEAGVREVCVTDHWNLVDQKGVFFGQDLDWGPSLAQWKRCRTRFAGRVELRLGVEIGNGILEPDRVDRALALPELDFVIGSLHSMSPKYKNVGIFTAAHQVTSRAQAVDILQDYMDTLEALAASDGYDVLGHIIYPLRYLPKEYGLTLAPYREQLAQVLKTVIAKGKGIEVNSSQGSTVEDWRALLELYRDLGGQVLTFGSDAHRPHQVGIAIPACYDLAREVGFRWVTTYKGRAPFFCPL